jgi:hypothetical protein
LQNIVKEEEILEVFMGKISKKKSASRLFLNCDVQMMKMVAVIATSNRRHLRHL